MGYISFERKLFSLTQRHISKGFHFNRVDIEQFSSVKASNRHIRFKQKIKNILTSRVLYLVYGLHSFCVMLIILLIHLTHSFDA